MNELNQKLAENLGFFFMDLREEVVKGLQECLKASKNS